MVTNSLRLEGIRWDEIKDLSGIQNQNGIKYNRMGQDGTGSDSRVTTSNPLCLVTSGVGGFDSLALPSDNL